MSDSEKIDRYAANLRGERDGAALYRVMAETESDPKLAEVYRRLAAVEERHAHFWGEQLRAAGGREPEWKPGARLRILRWLAKRFGSQIVVPVMAANESADRGHYDDQPEAKGTSLPRDERSHARVLEAILSTTPSGLPGSSLARLEGRHRAIGGNALRAAVLGANDGLVSNLSLVMGVAGLNLAPRTVLLTGIAGLLAGAISMAIGEWISVRSSTELADRQLRIEADELAAAPEEEEEELALIYEAKGLPAAQARELAHRLIADKDKALDTLAREELGIDPADKGGSAMEAALTSFGLFSFGAIFPVLPFMFLSGAAAVGASLALSAVVLFGVGAGITLVTGRPVFVSGLRQMAFGLAAAAVTFALGRLAGVNV